MSFIGDNTLQIMQSYVFDEDSEMCANFVPNSKGELSLEHVIPIKGTEVDGRKRCQLEEYNTYTFHSHPWSSWAYPSFDDINKVSKNLNIKVSIVATFWGIWEIGKELDGIKIELNQKTINDEILDKLGGLTKNNETDRAESGIKSQVWSEKLNKIIYHYVKKINMRLNPRIYVKFMPWEKIEGDLKNWSTYKNESF
jgi:hypothetical protein